MFSGLSAAKPVAQPSVTFVKLSSKFKELPDNYKKQFSEIEKYIRAQSVLRDEIDMHSKAVSLSNKGKISIDALTQKLNVLANAIQRETNGISNYRAEVQGELRNAEEASRNLARLRSTEASLQENIYLPSPYHWQKLEQFTHRMTQLKREIEEVDSYLTSAEHQNMHSSPKALEATLKGQHDALVSISAQLAELHKVSDQLRQKYIEIRTMRGDRDAHRLFKHSTDSALVDPFSSSSSQLTGMASLPFIPAAAAAATGVPVAGAAPAAATGFGATNAFGAAKAATTTGGFGFGAAKPAAAATTGGFGFGGAAKPAATTGGFGFGAAKPAAAATTTGGFGFGAAKPAATTGGFGFGGAAKPAATAGGFGFGGAAKPAASGFGAKATGFGATAKPAAAGGFGFGNKAAGSTGGFGFGGAAKPSGGGFSFGGKRK